MNLARTDSRAYTLAITGGGPKPQAPVAERPRVLPPDNGGSTSMVNYSYRVLESAGEGWRWQLISPSSEIVASGVADERAKAVAQAMLFWLTTVDERDAKKNNTSAVND